MGPQLCRCPNQHLRTPVILGTHLKVGQMKDIAWFRHLRLQHGSTWWTALISALTCPLLSPHLEDHILCCMGRASPLEWNFLTSKVLQNLFKSCSAGFRRTEKSPKFTTPTRLQKCILITPNIMFNSENFEPKHFTWFNLMIALALLYMWHWYLETGEIAKAF